MFDGPGSYLVGKIMASVNAAAEAEAIEILAPKRDASVLVIGYGPGVGIELMARRVDSGIVVGVDPSRAMASMATRRNKGPIAEGRVRLECLRLEQLGGADARFDGAVAVNSLQLCEPIEAAVLALSRLMKQEARLVSITHEWAAAKHAGSAASWVKMVEAALVAADFVDVEARKAKAERGRAIMLTAVRS
jgi:ubiquinone/menaquinone biosynthesis C-methylase UbiE